MLHIACVSRSSTLDCPFSLLCCIVFCLSSFCILCFILHVSLARPLVIAPLVYCVALRFACVRFVSYAPCCLCLWGRPLLFSPSGVTLLYSVLLVFVLYLMLHIACVSRSSTLDCPFNGYFVVLCFVCLRSVSYVPYCLCLWGRPLLFDPLVYCVV